MAHGVVHPHVAGLKQHGIAEAVQRAGVAAGRGWGRRPDDGEAQPGVTSHTCTSLILMHHFPVNAQ